MVDYGKDKVHPYNFAVITEDGISKLFYSCNIAQNYFARFVGVNRVVLLQGTFHYYKGRAIGQDYLILDDA